MNHVATKPVPWPLRVLLRAYLCRRIAWIETDVAADQQLMHTLPARIREHERVAAQLRCEMALLR